MPVLAEKFAIADYAIIGNCRTAALVNVAGLIDWLCLPQFDSPSIFAAILDQHHGGCFSITPRDPFTATRRYLGNSNVLETTFTTATGRLRLTDCMAVASESDKRRELTPGHEVIRLLECIDGSVTVQAICEPRPGYASAPVHADDRGKFGFCFESGTQTTFLRAEIPLHLCGNVPRVAGVHTLHRGERRFASLGYNDDAPDVAPSLGEQAARRLEQSRRWWEDWISNCTYDGPYREMVIRSALTLKLMAFAPSGAVVAAPTTSLPEELGGERNWDYRYCWLRDATLVLQALLDLGFATEGTAFLEWLLHATRLTAPQLQVVYDVFGETQLHERTLDQFDGYAGSKPVRIGNGAVDQLQLDVYGSVVDAAYRYVLRGGRIDRDQARVLVGIGNVVCRLWREPDEGIWEVRGGRAQHTHSKVMCWITLDRLLRLHARGCITVPASRFRHERDLIRQMVDSRGYNHAIDSYVDVFDGSDVDASLLRLILLDYVDADSPRAIATCRRIYEQLGDPPSTGPLLYRYRKPDGLRGGEGAFGVCAFWGVEALARLGRLHEAERAMEHLLQLGNDVGLFAEEIDPATGAQLGNFPQAFTHVGLINAALAIENACAGRTRSGDGA